MNSRGHWQWPRVLANVQRLPMVVKKERTLAWLLTTAGSAWSLLTSRKHPQLIIFSAVISFSLSKRKLRTMAVLSYRIGAIEQLATRYKGNRLGPS